LWFFVIAVDLVLVIFLQLVKEFSVYPFFNLDPEITMFFPGHFLLSTLVGLRLPLSFCQLVTDQL